ncbi:MAG: nucleoside deaminase [Pseudomonadota bacterium]
MDDFYFMEKALIQAQNALSEGEFPVGCIIALGDEVIAAGAREGTKGEVASEIDHAEIVALKNLNSLGRSIPRNRLVFYSTLEPCIMCYGAILLHGIRRIVYAYEDVMGGGTRCDLSNLTPLYRNIQVSIVPNMLRERSVVLLKAYFEKPENGYLRGSLLAKHTLSQSAQLTSSDLLQGT